jgi:hypothetical protein
LFKFADRRVKQICQQLRQISPRIDAVPAACAGNAAEDRCPLATALIANEQTILAVETDALHLAFGRVVVDRHGAINLEDA